MIPMIQQALTMGYTAVQILKYISSKFKGSAPKISQARQQGYSDEDILKFLGNKIKPKNQKNVDQQLSAQEKYLKSSGIKTKEERKETRDKFLSGALGVGATALGAYNMYQNYGGIMNSLTSSLGQPGNNPPPSNPPTPPPTSPQISIQPNLQPQSPQPIQPPPSPQPLSPSPAIGQQVQQQAQSPVIQAKQPASQGQVAQASQALPQEEQIQEEPLQPQQPVPLFEQLLGGIDPSTLDQPKQEQLKFLSMISDQLQSKGKTLADPEFKNLAKKIKSVLGGKPGMMLQENARFQAGQEARNANVKPLDIQEIQEPIEPEKPMTKGASVITPNGDIATVEDHPGKAAKVMVDGKQQVFDADDLTPVPDNHEEIGDLYQKLIDKIPEGHKSRVYDAIGYDPARNAIKYTYHDGKTYIIDDVPEEIAKEIANSGFLAKTSGGNYMGFYYKGNPSIGAGMHVLISDLQKLRGGKGKEYSYKFEELYSQHRLPKNILKEKHEREKQREREKKKAEKKRNSP